GLDPSAVGARVALWWPGRDQRVGAGARALLAALVAAAAVAVTAGVGYATFIASPAAPLTPLGQAFWVAIYVVVALGGGATILARPAWPPSPLAHPLPAYPRRASYGVQPC